MELVNFLEQLDSIQVIDHSNSWTESIKLCFNPLINQECISEDYVSNCIQKGNASKFYYLISQGLAIPHSSPSDGCSKFGLSLLIIKEGVTFETHQFNPVHCIIGLAATNNRLLIDFLVRIAEIFGNNHELLERLKKSNNKSDVLEILHSLDTYALQNII